MSKAIKFKNNMYLDTRGAVHNGTILKTYLDNMNTSITNMNTNITNLSKKGNYIVLGKPAGSEPIAWSVKSSWNKMPYERLIKSNGTVLKSYSSGTLKIAAGVKHIRAKGHITFDWNVSGTDYLFLRLVKNNEVVTKTISRLNRWGFITIEADFNVKENDIIEFQVFKDAAGTCNFCDYTDNFGAGSGNYCILEVLE